MKPSHQDIRDSLRSAHSAHIPANRTYDLDSHWHAVRTAVGRDSQTWHVRLPPFPPLQLLLNLSPITLNDPSGSVLHPQNKGKSNGVLSVPKLREADDAHTDYRAGGGFG